MKILVDLLAPDADVDVAIEDRKTDGWLLKWSTKPEAARQFTINDAVGDFDGGVRKPRVVLVYQKDDAE